MPRSHNSLHPYQSATTPRCSSNHGTSSASNPNANPNEDWTKISDLAERRRIQNRIAQRNYRKRLKRRLEDLEKRAALSLESPEQSHELLLPLTLEPRRGPRTDAKGAFPPNCSDLAWNSSGEPLPYSSIYEDPASIFAHQTTKKLSTSPPSMYSQSTAYHNGFFLGSYSQALPATIPAMAVKSSPAKRNSPYEVDDVVGSFNLSYGSMAGVEFPATTLAYPGSNIHVNPPEAFSQIA